MKKLKAFTLPELLIVLVIIGILVLIALPNLMPLISRTKATEAQLQLNHVYTLQKNYFYMHSKYSTDLDAIGFELIKADTKGFKIKATAVTDFDGDGDFNVWEIDQENKLVEVTKD